MTVGNGNGLLVKAGINQEENCRKESFPLALGPDQTQYP